jgi:hypothetical protein
MESIGLSMTRFIIVMGVGLIKCMTQKETEKEIPVEFADQIVDIEDFIEIGQRLIKNR